jgi:hypothetical protein
VSERVPLAQYPWWVRFTFFTAPGAGSRTGHRAYAGLSILLAILCVAAIMLVDLRERTALILAAGAIAFVISAVWYVLSLRWVDRHGSWDQIR